MSATPEQKRNFIAMVAPFAQNEYKKGKKILPSVCIAQACCESAYGTTKKMKNANAIFGIKVGKSKVHFGTAWHDKAYNTATHECYDGKTYEKINDFFRAYDSVEDCITDYYDMLCSCKRYRAAVGEDDYVKAITAIRAGGYATSPTYITTITDIIKCNDLTKYDRVTFFSKCSYSGNSIVEGLSSIGAMSEKDYRAKIAAVNGIAGYTGTDEQNKKLLFLLKAGLLVKP